MIWWCDGVWNIIEFTMSCPKQTLILSHNWSSSCFVLLFCSSSPIKTTDLEFNPISTLGCKLPLPQFFWRELDLSPILLSLPSIYVHSRCWLAEWVSQGGRRKTGYRPLRNIGSSLIFGEVASYRNITDRPCHRSKYNRSSLLEYLMEMTLL